MFNRITSIVVSALFIAGLAQPAIAKDERDIRLVLQITVDGLRGDLLTRFGKHFGKDGFRYLLNKGSVFSNAHYQHANTETIVGHSTLATGASPSVHGMIGNAWFDPESGSLGYNIEDSEYPLIPSREDMTKGEQVDPAQQAARSDGRSPRAILAPTLSDTLSAYYAGQSKVYGISGKDRGAVSMAGHVGKAFWFSTDSGDFVTSKYYYDDYPEWVMEWNGQRKAADYAGKSWKLADDASTYLLHERDDRPYESDLKGYGRTFPHPFGDADDKLLYTRLLVSPVGDQLTLDFAKMLVSAEELGKDWIPDYLSISFSGVDAVNHFFGPSSLEQEVLIRELDQTIAELLKFIEKKVGLKHTLIVLSADHGIADMPEYMAELGMSAGRLYPEDITAVANAAGLKQFGIKDIVKSFFRPYLYLDKKKIAAAGLDQGKVEQSLARALSDLEGVEEAVAKSTLGTTHGSPVVEMVRRNHNAARSGDIYVAQSPYWFLYSKGPIAAMHGSPYRYDAHVPIIFAGPGIRAQKVARQVHPVDVAPTIAALLGMSTPASAQGVALPEVLE